MNSVYYFTNRKDEIIYVGKTKNIKRRMHEHFERGHLPTECYQSVNKIFYAETGLSQYDTEIIETILIDKYKPKYNTEKVFPERYSISSFVEPELKWNEVWIEYDRESVNVYLRNPGYKCYDWNLSRIDRTDYIIENNLSLIRNRSKVFCHHEKLLEVEKIIDSAEIIYEYSNIDEPLDQEDYCGAYAVFRSNEIDKELLEYKFFFFIEDDLYGLPLYTRSSIKYL